MWGRRISVFVVRQPGCAEGSGASLQLEENWRQLKSTLNKRRNLEMRKIGGKHLLCFFLLAVPLSWAEGTEKDARKTDNETVWSQAKTRPLFARRKILPSQDGHTSKHRSDLMTPAHRCSRLMESCSSRVPCCDPCASCRCRLFNTICHCWKMNHLCLRKT